jgi:hypothetical protein
MERILDLLNHELDGFPLARFLMQRSVFKTEFVRSMEQPHTHPTEGFEGDRFVRKEKDHSPGLAMFAHGGEGR